VLGVKDSVCTLWWGRQNFLSLPGIEIVTIQLKENTSTSLISDSNLEVVLVYLYAWKNVNNMGNVYESCRTLILPLLRAPTPFSSSSSSNFTAVYRKVPFCSIKQVSGSTVTYVTHEPLCSYMAAER
jgi:hypothetical protein